MHFLFALFGSLLFTTTIECLPRFDPIAYHQSIFKSTTVAPKQHIVDNEPPTLDAKSDPLQLFMRFFNNAPFMKTVSELFDRPKQKLQAAPKVDQTHAIKIGQFNGQSLQQNDVPANGQLFSIDEPTQTKDQTTDAFDWKHILVGRDGLLTSIFNEFKERHKAELGKVKPNVPQADLTPEQNEFGKIFEAFLSKAKSGNFDEPLPELPFIGICNRISCGDLYKAVDEFRKSEFFSNFQTAISLLHDPKGLDIIGDVLANPELIENFVNGKNGGTLPEVVSGAKTVNRSASKDEITKDDGDFGVDFSEIEDGKTTTLAKKTDREMPLISANLDYYSSVDTDTGKIEKEERIPDHVDVEEHMEEHVKLNKTESIPALPEISMSVDETPQDYNVAIEETVQIPKQENVVKQTTSTTTSARPITSPTTRTVTTTVRPFTTTKHNFRIKDSYYAMYYDI